MKLHLGVLDVPYTGEHGTTTGDVAGFLEAKYGVMQRFFQLHGQDAANAMAAGIAGALGNMLAGGPPGDPFGTAMGKIETAFRTYIDAEEITRTGAPGVPTLAALQGKSKRFKRQFGPRRPSFIDSGLYEATFKAWVTD